MVFSYAYSLKSNEVTLTNCDREPVHIPGCIQPWGVLLALHPADFTIMQASDNAADWLGQSAEALVGQNLTAVIGQTYAAILTVLLQKTGLELLPRYVFSVFINGQNLDALAHFHNGVLLLEFELADTTVQPQQVYADVNRIAGKLQRSASLLEFSNILASEVRQLTGLDRVMIYRFQEDLSGHVFAESKRADLHTYLDLHYPAEDIPLPAREIFRKIWIRPVPNVDYQPAEMVPLFNPATGQPLDMTYAFLRGASVMYTDYLKNMGVQMALTMSIVVEGKLWGLIACHHMTPKTVPWPVRAAAELLAQIASLQLRAVENVEYGDYRTDMDAAAHRLVDQMLTGDQELPALVQTTPGLLEFLTADGVAVVMNNEWTTRGAVPNKSQLNELLAWLKQEFAQTPKGTEILHTHTLGERLAPAKNYAALASGLLAIPISRNWEEMICWFRREQVQTVNWAGDPYSKLIEESPHGPRLMPRSSFALWQESVSGQSLPWQKIELQSARRLRLAIMEVVVARSERIATLNRALTASNTELDAFAYVTSHDLREPLRGIYHYAHYLKENIGLRDDPAAIGQLDSLLRLTKRMDGLIESLLHFSRVGRTKLETEILDMHEMAGEAKDVVMVSRAEKRPQIKILPHLPPLQGDRVRIHELLVNLLSNAVKYCDQAQPEIEVGHTDTAQGPAYYVKDNGIGIAPQNYDKVFEMFKRLHGKDKYGGGSGAGLPIVKKIVELHSGKIWLKSALGKGTTFFFNLESN